MKTFQLGTKVRLLVDTPVYDVDTFTVMKIVPKGTEGKVVDFKWVTDYDVAPECAGPPGPLRSDRFGIICLFSGVMIVFTNSPSAASSLATIEVI